MRTAIVALVLIVVGLVMPVTGQDDEDAIQAAKDARIVETLLRVKSIDISERPELQQAVARYLKRVEGTPRFVELVEQLQFTQASDQLLDLALAKPDDNLGVSAARALMRMRQTPRLRQAMQAEDPEQAAAAIRVVGFIGNQSAVDMLQSLIDDEDREMAQRVQAVRSIASSARGQLSLIETVEAGKLNDALRFAAGDVLHGSNDPQIRARVGKVIPLPASSGRDPLPPISELAKLRGDAAAGKLVFAEAGTCAKCHLVAGQGKEVGPDLSEIGSKLSRSAMYESILDPSAGISHNYESYLVATIDGTLVTGVLVSESEDKLVVKDAEAIEHEFPTDDVEDFVKQSISIMPAGLQEDLTQKQLVDLVEYLMTLKKQ